MSEPDRIAIVDLADDLQVRKQRIFKILHVLAIVPHSAGKQIAGTRTLPP